MIPFIDMHCDTLGVLRRYRRRNPGISWEEAGLAVTAPGLSRGGCLCQNMAMFVNLRSPDGFEDGDGEPGDPWQAVLEMHALFGEVTAENKDRIVPVRTCVDIERAGALGLSGAMLTVEEGGVCRGRIDRLRALHDFGVRMLTITWNYENELGHPNASPYAVSGERAYAEGVLDSYEGAPGIRHEPGLRRPMGLKETGFAFLHEMKRLGMIADVSHLSDDGFYDVAEELKGPFVASHSNTRALCPVPRNLSDDMIRVLASCGGAAGLAFFPGFVDPGKNPRQTVEGLARHARHFIDVGGVECVGIGSDFDGCEGEMEIDNAAKMQLLAEGLAANGFSADEIDHIFYKNALRVYRDVIG